MNQQLSQSQLELLASWSTPIYLPSQSSVLASEKTHWLWPSVRGDQTYKSNLRDFCSVLLTELKATNPSEVSAINRSLAAYRYCLLVLMHSFARVASLPCEYEVVGISLNNNDYSPGRRYASLHYGPVAKIVRMLSAPEVGIGLCRVRRGTFDRTTRSGVRTRLRPLQGLMDRMTVAGLVWSTHPYKVAHPAKPFPVGIRAGDTDELLEVFGPLSLSEMVIPKVNSRLKVTRLALHFPDYRSYKECWNYADGKFRFHQSGNQLTRQFKYDLESGGRLYGHWAQGVPERLRQRLTINGMPVVEYDYRGMQVHLAYSSLGLACAMDDPYRVPGYAEHYRDAFKAIFLRIIGSDETQSLPNIFRHGISEALGRQVTDVEVAELTEAFWGVHEPLRQLANTEAWRHLQSTESEIALTVMNTLDEQGITCIPIFDGFVVQSRNGPELRMAMKDAVKDMRSITQPRQVEISDDDV